MTPDTPLRIPAVERHSANWPGRHPAIRDRFRHFHGQVDIYLAGDVNLAGSSQKLTAAELHSCFVKQGLEMTSRLSGQFALAIWQPEQAKLHLITDKFATVPVYFQTEPVASFSNDPAQLISHTPRAISPQALFNYLYFHCIPSPDCIFQGLAKVPPATVISITPTGQHQQRYWQPDYHYLGDRDQAHEALREALEKAVIRSLDRGSDTAVGAFLSGGLDSSTVIAMMHRQEIKPLRSFTIGFNEPAYDESPYAQIVAEAFETEHTVFEVTPAHVREQIGRIAAFSPEPFGNSSALPALFCSLAAQAQGVSVLLAGDGGDELFAGNSRYLQQKVFTPFNHLPGWGQRALWQTIHGLPERMPLANKARSYLHQAATPLPWRLKYHSFLSRNPLETIFSKAFLAQVDSGYPARLEMECYRAAPGQHELEKMLYFDWKFTLADNDLVKVSTMAHLAGIEVRYPMLDDELLALSCRIPPRWMLPGRRLRGFYKDALASVLPKATLTKSKQGFGLPFGVWLQQDPQLRKLVREAFQSLKSRGILHHDFLDRLLQLHEQGHAHYYGEQVWVLTMLELWLQQHGY